MNQLVLTKIAPWPAGRMMALIYLVLGIVVTPLMFLYALFSPQDSDKRALSIFFTLFLPFFYAICGLVAGMLAAFLFNLFAGMFGGIPLGFQAASAEPAPRASGVRVDEA